MTQVEVLVLAALREGPAHGYAVTARVNELTRGRAKLRPGNVYRVLDRMEREEWVRETPAAAGTDDRRRVFALTARGRREVDAELSMYAAVHARTGRLGEGHSNA